MAVRGFPVVRAVGWSLTWAVGVSIGTALGAYLTAVSGTGAPGVEQLDLSDIVTIPLVSGIAVFIVVFFGRLIVWNVRGPAAEQPHADDDEEDQGGSDGVLGQAQGGVAGDEGPQSPSGEGERKGEQ